MKKVSEENITIYYDIGFNRDISKLDLGNHAENWPVTYILYNNTKGKAYVGETTGFKNRMYQHSNDPTKADYKKALFIDYGQATKSTILHLEAFLIRCLSVSHELLSDLSNKKTNSNKHSYYNEKRDEEMCKKVWKMLKDEVGIVKEDYDSLIKKNEFKYSPYILLNENQNTVLNKIIDELCYKENNMIVIEGASGTGKSALAIQLFKQLTNYSNFNGIIDDSMIGENVYRLYEMANKFHSKGKNYNIAYVAPMKNFCTIIRKSVGKISGLKKRDLENNKNYINEYDLEKIRIYSGNDLSKLSKYVKKGEKLFDLMIVDEAQRLNRRYNQTNRKSYIAFNNMNRVLRLPINKNRDDGNQLDWILKLSKNQVFFYDKRQSIRSSDIPAEYFEKIFEKATYKDHLTVEERCRGGEKYISYVDSIFSDCPPESKQTFHDYEFKIYDDYDEMIKDLELKVDDLSIKAAGYFFEANDKKNSYDVKIGNSKQKWNQTDRDWINSKKRSENEIGCIHVLEGVDADYVGVVVGDEITYNSGRIDVVPDKYKDKFGKKCIDNNEQLVQFISNVYYILLTRAMKGTYLYIIDPSMKEYLERYINKKNN